METQDAIDMMRRASDEIEQLRREVAFLQPKAAAYDLLSKVVSVSIREPSQSYDEDFAYRLRQKAKELQQTLVKPKPAVPPSDKVA